MNKDELQNVLKGQQKKQDELIGQIQKLGGYLSDLLELQIAQINMTHD